MAERACPIDIDRVTVGVAGQQFLGVHIVEELKWFLHTDAVVKAPQHLFNLRRLSLPARW